MVGEINNADIPHVAKKIGYFIDEMNASQSALLAEGFLPFDAERLAVYLEQIAAFIRHAKVADRPETHPHQEVTA